MADSMLVVAMLPKAAESKASSNALLRLRPVQADTSVRRYEQEFPATRVSASAVARRVCYTRAHTHIVGEFEVTVVLKSLPAHRLVVLVWQSLIVAILIWTFIFWREDGEIHWLWMPLFITPLLVLFATLTTMQSNHRAVAYWVLAAVSIPTAASGLTSITGWMFIISIVMLIWAARRENPADEFVQM